MARLLWPIRQPVQAERERLEQIWRHVITRAGVRGARRFRIRVVDLPEANAHSVGRDLICVTTGALDQLGDRELAGVLAHELGHHLRMHTSVSAFLVWVLLPLQAIALLGSLLATPVAALANALGTEQHPVDGYGADARSADRYGLHGPGVHGHRGRRWISGCARAALRLGHGIRVVFAAPGVAAFAAKNAAGRSAEYRVDAFAVDIGLGPELLSALRWFAANESTGCGLLGDSHYENEYGRSDVPATPPSASRVLRIHRLTAGWRVSPPALSPMLAAVDDLTIRRARTADVPEIRALLDVYVTDRFSWTSPP